MKKIETKVIKSIEIIEKGILVILLLALLSVVIYSVIMFIGLLFSEVILGVQDSFSIENDILIHLHKIFGGFLSVLIGVELLHTIKMYLKEGLIHVEIVLLVALIGISRHVIDLNIAHMKPFVIMAISSLIIALSVGYFLIKRGIRKPK
ncbi:phosphate-starvation-inducible PsiE family protein [Tenacibaculum ovolyticum]|uniref:phosphate-starvation-inducible PsiE family protein n=1 Tax=Tenacibaculum ovolyticum TaxID=104270 RepID=UPI0022F3F83D|nr:phosphate-starvation-inducible PsiE family protein [Tenacibaculum ovolyticum]WBX75366.1 phosphate-starvation-inducible PsiE family protein [Tenacibaculum ovolyticum]